MSDSARDLLPAERTSPRLDGAIVVTMIAVGATGAALAIGALLLSGAEAGLGVAVGGLVATVNLWVFAQVVHGVLAGGSRGKLWALAGALKLLALFGGAWLLLRGGWTSPLTLVIGYGALPVGIALGAFLRPREEIERVPVARDEQSTGVPAEDLVTGSPTGDRPRAD